MPKGKEFVSIDQALRKMLELFDSWGLKTKDWVLVDEFAYRLQGYDVAGPEVKQRHIDVYVNPQACPWPEKKERSIIPPLSGGYFDQWNGYMEQTGYGLDMLRADPAFLNFPKVEYTLTDGRSVQLMRSKEMTKLFVEQTIMKYNLTEVDGKKMMEWINKLKLIRQAALLKGDVDLADFCEEKFKESRSKWHNLVS